MSAPTTKYDSVSQDSSSESASKNPASTTDHGKYDSARWTVFAGCTAATAEVCWTYLMPALHPDWQASLPTSISGLGSFLLAAVATDLVVAFAIYGMILLAIALARSIRKSSGKPSARFVAPWLLSASLMTYLLGGWYILFFMAPREKTPGRLLMTVSLVALICLLATLGFHGVQYALRRRPVAARIPSAIIMIAMITTLLAARHRYVSTLPPQPAITASNQPSANVLLITLDTLRADYLGCYGNEWIKTPTLDQLADQSVVFDQAFSQAPSTTPSHASIMTSAYPFEHGAENGRPIRGGMITLADVLRANGYKTVAFTAATTTRSINSGLDRGFDHYVDSLAPWSEALGRDEFQNLIFFYLLGVAQNSQISGDVVTRRATRWLEQRDQSTPFFCWLHYFDPHTPYGSPAPFSGMYDQSLRDKKPMLQSRRAYAEDVSFTDHQVGAVLSTLRELGLFDDTLIVVTSDHGEAFGEKHGEVVEVGHGRYLYDTTQHVPLLIKPVGAQTARRISTQVELTDLAPTVLDYLNVSIPKQFMGNSLVELLTGQTEPNQHRPARSFSVTRRPNPKNSHQHLYVQQLAVRRPPYKYIAIPRIGASELYDISIDPAEANDILTQRPLIAQRQHEDLVRFWQSDRDPTRHPAAQLAATVVQQLEGLGYLDAQTDDEP